MSSEGHNTSPLNEGSNDRELDQPDCGSLIVVSAPSGAGKSTLVHRVKISNANTIDDKRTIFV